MREIIREGIEKTVSFSRKHISRENEDLPLYVLIFLSFVVFVFGINLFVELTDELSGKALKAYDQKITDFVISFRTPELNNFFQFITDLGDLYAYAVVSGIATIFFLKKFRSWKFVLQLLGVLLVSALSNIALKRFFDRARPDIEHLVVAKSLSYPSGHAMSAMAFYGFLIYLLHHVRMPGWLRSFLTMVFFFLILAIGTSRIYLGVHFPSDVAAGFLGGLIWVAFCVVLYNIITLLRKKKRRHRVAVSRKKDQ